MPEISRRASSLGTENAFVVLAEVNALARQGRDIISFCIGQPDFPAPDSVQEAAIRAIKSGKHGYPPSAGVDELREAAARYLAATRGGLPIRPEDVVVGAGAKPFIAYAVLSTTDYGAGDEVIYPNPGFPIYESQIVASGAKPVPIHLREARRFAFDLTDLEKLITPKSRLLILNYPHNPTGGLLSRKELEEIAAILRRHPQVWGYADEIYSRLAYAGAFFSIAQVPGGAFYVWPNVTEACRRIGAADSEDLRRRLLNEAGVAVLADIHFGTRVPGEGQHVRFSYAASREVIEAGVQRMADFIRKNTKKAA